MLSCSSSRLKLSTFSNERQTDVKRRYATGSMARSSFITNSPMVLLETSASPSCINWCSILETMVSALSSTMGRFLPARRSPSRSFVRLYGSDRPFRFSTVIESSIRSYVVKRVWQAVHSRRRRTVWSSTRESITLVSLWQFGQSITLLGCCSGAVRRRLLRPIYCGRSNILATICCGVEHQKVDNFLPVSACKNAVENIRSHTTHPRLNRFGETGTLRT